MLTGPMTRPSSQLRRDLRAMLGDGVSFSVMVGVGESYLPAFALALGMWLFQTRELGGAEG